MGKPGGVHLDLGGSPAGANGIWHFHTAVAIIRSIPFNAKIRRDLADDVAGNRGHNLGSGVKDPARVIHHDQHQNFRVVRRKDGGKADGLAVVAVRAVLVSAFPVQLFSRTGFAADAVARHISAGTTVIVQVIAGTGVTHVVFHHGADLLTDFLADDLALNVGFSLPYHVAGVVRHIIHHIGGHQVAAVHGGSHGGCHLDQGQLLGLAERGGVQVRFHLLHLLLGFGDALCLIRQVNASGLGQAKRLVVVIKEFGAHFFRHLDKVQVAAVVQRPGHIQPAVSVALGAAVAVFPLGIGEYCQVAAAVKLLVRPHQAGIQRRSGRHELKD